LNPHYKTEEKEFLYFSAKLTLTQKKAVAHWLQLELERDRERRPELYERGAPTLQRLASDKWRELA
jgi:hypothetical protein